MSQDPLRTPSEATEDDDLLRDLRASMQAEDSKACGFTVCFSLFRSLGEPAP